MMITEFTVDFEDILGLSVKDPKVAENDVLEKENDETLKMLIVKVFIFRLEIALVNKI